VSVRNGVARPLLAVNNIEVIYDHVILVLRGVSLRVPEGGIVALLGANGAGKSTTLKAIVGMVEVTAGEIRFEGRSLRDVPTHRVARLGVGLVPEDRRIFADLSVLENLMVGARADGGWTVDRIFGLFPRLAGLARQRGGSLSGGEQQMLTIARTLMTGPRLLLLDEPSEGLAPVVVAALADDLRLRKVREAGLSWLRARPLAALARPLAEAASTIASGLVARWSTTSRSPESGRGPGCGPGGRMIPLSPAPWFRSWVDRVNLHPPSG